MSRVYPFAPSSSRLSRSFLAGVCLGVASGGIFFIQSAFAQQASDTTGLANAATEVNRIKDDINALIARKQQIEQDIAKYETELQKVGGEKATLQNAIHQLELERKKVQSDLIYTKNKIGATDLEIQKLDIEIQDAETHIARARAAIEEILRSINETDRTSLVETLLSHEDISAFWEMLDGLAQVRGVMSAQVRDLTELRNILEGKVDEHQTRRGDLVALKNQFAGQQNVLEVNKTEKNQLLTETKNEEATYQQLLAEKKVAKEQFERELREYEARLKFILDPTSIPTVGTAVFGWPLDTVRITQYFGNTEFAKTAAYNGAGHNGIDFGTPRGTSVRAALSGTVLAINTQVATMCQYGKWILIRHQNGLTTLYAHLSVVSVNTGDTVSTGQVIGYSGDTGYATGPHLHFTVYASEAVRFMQYTCNSGTTLTVPVSAPSGYLNPLLYLPAL